MKKIIIYFSLVLINFSFTEFYSLGKEVIVEEEISLNNLPEDSGTIKVWIPFPINDNLQYVEDYKVTSSLGNISMNYERAFSPEIITEKEYGNKIIFLKADKLENRNSQEIKVLFRVDRKEFEQDSSVITNKEIRQFLKSNKRVPVTRQIKELARQITKGKNNDIEKARAIYDYIIEQFTYSKDDPLICGLGDSLVALKYKKGICSDYHSLFMSMVRSLGIPVKFEIGFPLHGESGEIKGYHCWAKFYAKGKGWIPVDISEADKHPEKQAYFFGHIDEERIHLTTGRDISLKYAKDKEVFPLNFFVFPYVEVNGKQFYNVNTEITFREIKKDQLGLR